MEVRLALDDKLVNGLKDRTKIDKTVDLIKEAIALLDWATEEAGKGRTVLSVNSDGGDPIKIESIGLRQAKLQHST
jgi:hypothetical protein